MNVSHGDFGQILDEALEDHRLSRNELRALKAYVADHAPSPERRAELRARAFDRAKKAASEMGAEVALEWIERVVKVLNPVTASTSVRTAFSPGQDCLALICDAFREAQKSVDVCVFTITDDRITERIVEAHKRGVRIRIISDDDKSEDRGSDVDRLDSSGIDLRVDTTDAHMHHKFAIFDGARLLNGSYNWTRSAAAYNCENILITDDARLVSSYAECFETLWRRFENS